MAKKEKDNPINFDPEHRSIWHKIDDLEKTQKKSNKNLANKINCLEKKIIGLLTWNKIYQWLIPVMFTVICGILAVLLYVVI